MNILLPPRCWLHYVLSRNVCESRSAVSWDPKGNRAYSEDDVSTTHSYSFLSTLYVIKLGPSFPLELPTSPSHFSDTTTALVTPTQCSRGVSLTLSSSFSARCREPSLRHVSHISPSFFHPSASKLRSKERRGRRDESWRGRYYNGLYIAGSPICVT